MDSIYLDHNATTPIHPEVVEAMLACYRDGHANPASQHAPGKRARQVLDDARQRTAEILGANLSHPDPDRLIFTSGGTEANCLALLGIALARRGTGPGRVVISAVEHPCVIEPAEHLLEQGWRLDTIAVTSEGVVRPEHLGELLDPAPAVVSVILGNHETGVLQPVAQLAALCREAGVPIHTDAVQVVGKLPVDFRQLGVDALSIAAHKFQGPLGIGALLLTHDVPIRPILFGGAQQAGTRPGTESTALAVGMATALELWQADHEEHTRRLAALRDRFEGRLAAGYEGLQVNGAAAERLPQTSNLVFPGVDGQMLLMALDTVGVACSAGSACSSGSSELSPTLRAMQLPSEIVASSLRFSLAATTSEAEVDEAVGRILHVANELRM